MHANSGTGSCFSIVLTRGINGLASREGWVVGMPMASGGGLYTRFYFNELNFNCIQSTDCPTTKRREIGHLLNLNDGQVCILVAKDS